MVVSLGADNGSDFCADGTPTWQFRWGTCEEKKNRGASSRIISSSFEATIRGLECLGVKCGRILWTSKGKPRDGPWPQIEEDIIAPVTLGDISGCDLEVVSIAEKDYIKMSLAASHCFGSKSKLSIAFILWRKFVYLLRDSSYCDILNKLTY